MQFVLPKKPTTLPPTREAGLVQIANALIERVRSIERRSLGLQEDYRQTGSKPKREHDRPMARRPQGNEAEAVFRTQGQTLENPSAFAGSRILKDSSVEQPYEC